MLRQKIVPILASALVSLATCQSAQAELIRDQAGFFSPAVVQSVETAAAKLADQGGPELRVATFSKPPTEYSGRLRAGGHGVRDQVFSEWLKQQAKADGAKGVYVLICREPSHLRVGVSEQLHRRGFTVAQRDTLRNGLVDSFKRHKYDQGLQDLLKQVQNWQPQTSRTTTGGAVSEPRQTGPANRGSGGLWSLLPWAIGALMLFWLFRAFTGVFANSPQANSPQSAGYPGGYGGYPAQPMGMGGRGLGGSLLTGLFGSMAGMWLYDTMFHNSAHGHWGSNSPTGMQDPGTNSSGGDWFGGDVGGGDVGDFDSSGGDFGGDSGGDF